MEDGGKERARGVRPRSGVLAPLEYLSPTKETEGGIGNEIVSVPSLLLSSFDVVPPKSLLRSSLKVKPPRQTLHPSDT